MTRTIRLYSVCEHVWIGAEFLVCWYQKLRNIRRVCDSCLDVDSPRSVFEIVSRIALDV